MIILRRSDARGRADYGWLDSRHTFSFGAYYDPRYMGFRALRVLNEDRVDPGEGFPTHPHRDMEILSYVLSGALAHEDSMGNGSVIRPGEVQRMTAGAGVFHSERNASNTEPVHFLQIWLVPEARGLPPGYEQKAFSDADKRGRLCLVASRDGEGGSVVVHQDIRVFAALLACGARVEHALAPTRHAYVHMARGRARLGDVELGHGDGAALSEERSVALEGAGEGAEILLFDLA